MLAKIGQICDRTTALGLGIIGTELLNYAGWASGISEIPKAAQQLIKVVQLKQLAKKLGFSRIKPEAKQHV